MLTNKQNIINYVVLFIYGWLIILYLNNIHSQNITQKITKKIGLKHLDLCHTVKSLEAQSWRVPHASNMRHTWTISRHCFLSHSSSDTSLVWHWSGGGGRDRGAGGRMGCWQERSGGARSGRGERGLACRHRGKERERGKVCIGVTTCVVTMFWERKERGL